VFAFFALEPGIAVQTNNKPVTKLVGRFKISDVTFV
jgi:hypothetical protein